MPVPLIRLRRSCTRSLFWIRHPTGAHTGVDVVHYAVGKFTGPVRKREYFRHQIGKNLGGTFFDGFF